MPDLRTALWLGARLLAAGCTVIPWPDELGAAYFRRHPPAARA